MHWPFVRTMIHREVVASTSDDARRLVVEGRERLPLAVWASCQTRGRGRGEQTWWSDAGSLTFTLAIDPARHGLRAEHEPRLALTAAVALIDVLEPLLPGGDLGIRWPNDVEAGGRKLGGILPERVDTPGGHRLLIGVGLNVRTRLDDAPAEVRGMATSVEALGAPLPARDAIAGLLRAFLGRFEAGLAALGRDDPALADRWGRLDTLAGRPVRVDLGTRVLAGRGAGIDVQGALRLEGDAETFAVYGGRVLRDP